MARRIVFTFEQVLETLKSVVTEFGPEHIGRLPEGGCRYAVVVDGRLVASCIVGQFLDRMGLLGLTLMTEPNGYGNLSTDFIIYPAVSDTKGAPEQAGTCTSLVAYLQEFGIEFTEQARRLLVNAQLHQDGGRSWGASVHQALVDLNDGKPLSDAQHALASWEEMFN